MGNIKAVLDSNQFIFALRDKKEFCVNVLKLSGIRFTAIICDTIIKEVYHRLKELEGKDFASFVVYIIKNLKIEVIDDRLVPFDVIKKYRDMGAKEEDSLIAAFAEWVEADYLITKNRHFLKEIKIDKFKTINAKGFMDILKKDNSI